jgi:hypothetical protein
MKILIHTRNCELAADFKDIANDKLITMERFGVDIDRVEVEVIHEANPKLGKHSHRIILTSHGSGPLIRAEASEFNDVAAFDVAMKTFEMQIRKIHENSKEHNRETLRDKKLT